jgi:adhesin transport system outer membrane protein
LNRFTGRKFAVFLAGAGLTILCLSSIGLCADAPAAPSTSSASATTQTTAIPVTLKASVSELLKTHDRVKAAESVLQSAEHMRERAKGAWYPRLNAVLDGGREDINKHDTSQTTSTWRNVQTLSLNQTVYDFGATTGGVTQATGARNEAEAKLEQVRQEVAMQGVSAYLGLVRAREMLRYAVRSEENIKTLSGMQEALVERGVGLSYEELQIKAQLAGSQALRVNAERALVAARNNYRQVYNVAISDQQLEALLLPAMPEKGSPKNIDDAVTLALNANPMLLELQYGIETRQGDKAQREAAMYPKVEAVAEAQRKVNDQGEIGVRTESRAGLQVTYNLFQGFRDVENVRAASNDILGVRKALLDRRHQVEERVRNAWNDMQTLNKTVALYDNQANITWSFLELIKRKKALGGEVNLLDILVGERDYISATSAKVGADIDLITAAYTMLYQMGQLKPDVVEN